MAFQSNIQPFDYVGNAIGAYAGAAENKFAGQERNRIAQAETANTELMNRVGGMAAGGDYEGAMRESYAAGNVELGNEWRESLSQMDSEEREQRVALAEATGRAAGALARVPQAQRGQAADMASALLLQQFPDAADQVFEFRRSLEENNFSDEAVTTVAQTLGQAVEEARTIMSLGGGDVGVFDRRTGDLISRVEGETMDEFAQREDIKARTQARYREPRAESERSQSGRFRALSDGRIFDTWTGEYKDAESGGGASIIPGGGGASDGGDAEPVAVGTPEEAAQLPPGTLIRTPDGRVMRTRGQ